MLKRSPCWDNCASIRAIRTEQKKSFLTALSLSLQLDRPQPRLGGPASIHASQSGSHGSFRDDSRYDSYQLRRSARRTCGGNGAGAFCPKLWPPRSRPASVATCSNKIDGRSETSARTRNRGNRVVPVSGSRGRSERCSKAKAKRSQHSLRACSSGDRTATFTRPLKPIFEPILRPNPRTHPHTSGWVMSLQWNYEPTRPGGI